MPLVKVEERRKKPMIRDAIGSRRSVTFVSIYRIMVHGSGFAMTSVVDFCIVLHGSVVEPRLGTHDDPVYLVRDRYAIPMDLLSTISRCGITIMRQTLEDRRSIRPHRLV